MPFLISEDVLFQPVSGELVLLHMRSGEYFGLAECGSQLWNLLAEGLDRDTIKHRLAVEHNEDPAVVSSDIDAFLAELCAADLVRKTD